MLICLYYAPSCPTGVEKFLIKKYYDDDKQGYTVCALYYVSKNFRHRLPILHITIILKIRNCRYNFKKVTNYLKIMIKIKSF